MPKHEFGIMPDAPHPGVRIDEYAPWNYENMISINDDYIEPIVYDLTGIRMYAHTLDNPYPGLAYCGITIIPPKAMEPFLYVIADGDHFEPLRKLLKSAKERDKYVIHFGL